MAIYLPGTAEEADVILDELTPREIVSELDKYVVGQNAAKRAVAIALRNRMRRQKLSPELAEEIMPKNIIMIGPTGVGKTEIARRLARLANSPFLKVEASKFTEVGYVGRDVESIVRDLVEISIDMVREERLEEVEDKAEMNAEERLLDVLLPAPPPTPGHQDGQHALPGGGDSHQRSDLEASKFTEVGYVGRDVESIVRDLVEISIDMVREERLEEVEDKAEMNAEERLLDVLLPAPPPTPGHQDGQHALPGGGDSHQR